MPDEKLKTMRQYIMWTLKWCSVKVFWSNANTESKWR